MSTQPLVVPGLLRRFAPRNDGGYIFYPRNFAKSLFGRFGRFQWVTAKKIWKNDFRSV
jgi:hypothetical protein